jgi:predicted GIY-YIG superfamily endonuclease
MFYVYILRSRWRPAQTCVGYSTNPRHRLQEHNQGRCPHTSKFMPWEVVWYGGLPAKRVLILS